MWNNFFVSYKYLITLNNVQNEWNIYENNNFNKIIIISYTGTATLSAIMSGSFVFAFEKLIIQSHLKTEI